MRKETAEFLRKRNFRVARPVNLDLHQTYPHDYTTINNGTNILWDFWSKEEAILGRIAGTESHPWYAAYPGIQYVHNQPESIHMVIAPKRDQFVSPSDLPVEDTARAAAFIQKFLEPRDRQAYAGYNIGPEKAGSQMWWTWHIHLVQFGKDELQNFAQKPRIIWEPWPVQIEEVMETLFVERLLSQNTVPKAERVDLSELDRFGFSSYGSSLLRFDPRISPHELATVMLQVDREYKTLHSELKGIFFEQREEKPSTKKTFEKMITSLKEYAHSNDLSDQTTDYLAKFGKEVLPETLPETPTRNSPLTLPNYSAAIMRDEKGTYFLFQPHILRKKASALSSLGIFLNYTLDTDRQRVQDYEKKKEQNAEIIKQINASLQLACQP